MSISHVTFEIDWTDFAYGEAGAAEWVWFSVFQPLICDTHEKAVDLACSMTEDEFTKSETAHGVVFALDNRRKLIEAAANSVKYTSQNLNERFMVSAVFDIDSSIDFHECFAFLIEDRKIFRESLVYSQVFKTEQDRLISISFVDMTIRLLQEVESSLTIK